VAVTGPSRHPRSFFEELKARRVYRVAAVYVVVAFALLQGADLLLPVFDVPERLFRFLVIIALAGFPVALVLAWVFDLTPDGLERTGAKMVVRGALPTVLWRSAAGAVVIVVLAAVAFALSSTRSSGAGSDRHRVMVFPMVVSGTGELPATVGEDVATMIGHALDGTGPLRWIDGWPLLDVDLREDVRRLTLEEARQLAAGRGCGFFVMGRVVVRHDSAEVFLELRETLAGEAVARGESVGDARDPWRVGLRAVNDLLPHLIPTGLPHVAADFAQRPPGAVARFLLGESSLRRTEFRPAFQHFAAAFEEDPTFAVAAIRGAQAASWEHDVGSARSLIDAALQLELLPRDRAFASGVRAYLEADAETAVRELEAALAADSMMAVAWAQLGEVYRHLAPMERPRGRADVAFGRALALDAGAVHVLYHVLEDVISSGDVARATPLWDRFRAIRPDSSLAAQLTFMYDCVARGAANVTPAEWHSAARRRPFELLVGATQLSAAGRQTACAEAMYLGLMTGDTARDAAWQNRYWSAFVGLIGVQVARNRPANAERLLVAATESFEDLRGLLVQASVTPAGLALPHPAPSGYSDSLASVPERVSAPARRENAGSLDAPRTDPVGYAPLLSLFAAALHPGLAELGAVTARQEFARVGPSYEGISSSEWLWLLAYWATRLGEPGEAELIAARLNRHLAGRAQRDLDYLAVTLAGHRALAAGDTAEALPKLGSTLVSRDALNWLLLAPLGFERLTQAQIALQRGDAGLALRLGSGFDGSGPLAFAFFLPQSLQIRRDAATRSRRPDEAARYRDRLRALGWPADGPAPVAQLP
jgi:hypothetical protein